LSGSDKKKEYICRHNKIAEGSTPNKKIEYAFVPWQYFLLFLKTKVQKVQKLITA
jgi:hypothetical protein